MKIKNLEDKKLIVMFHKMTVLKWLPFRKRRKGERTKTYEKLIPKKFVYQTFIKIASPDDPLTIVHRPMESADKLRWPKAYKDFLSRK